MANKIIQLPDGRKVSFPAEMSNAEIKSKIREKFPNIDKPMQREGESAAMDDPLNVSAVGVKIPTDYGRQQAVRHVLQAPSFGWGEELESFFTGTPVEQIRSEMKQFDVETEGGGSAAEAAAGLMIPFGGKGKLIKTIAGAFGYGAGKSEGDVSERMKEGAISTAIGVPFSFLTSGFLNLASKPLRQKALVAERKQTTESLQTAAQQAYKDADLKGTFLSPNDAKSLNQQVISALDVDFDPVNYPRANRILGFVRNATTQQAKAGGQRMNVPTGMTFQKLEDLRRKMWNEYNSAKKAGDGNEMGYILGMINKVDDHIDQFPDSSELIKNARYLYKQSQKASALDAAIDLADLQVASTGSGGNTVNAYLQAVKKILNDPKQKRFFDQNEVAIMEEFIRTGGGNSQIKRALSKLSPSGNGLMVALAGIGSSINPKLAAMFGLGTAAKMSSEASAREGIQKIFSQFTKGTPSENIIQPPYRLPPTMLPIMATEPAKKEAERLGILGTMP
jgi:hypothetical protein